MPGGVGVGGYSPPPRTVDAVQGRSTAPPHDRYSWLIQRHTCVISHIVKNSEYKVRYGLDGAQ
jgi:hypothetical protein